MLCRLGFRNEVKSDVTTKIGIPWGCNNCCEELLDCGNINSVASVERGLRSREPAVLERDGMSLERDPGGTEGGAVHSEAQGRGDKSVSRGDASIQKTDGRIVRGCDE